MSDDERPLSGAAALVTGGARRIGRAIALGLARAGADVVVHFGASRAEAQTTADEASALGVRSAALQADLADADQSAGLVDRAADALGGRLTVLVNNASIFPSDTVLDFAPADLHRNVEVNALAPLLLARALAGRGEATDVINLLDTRVVDYDRAHAAYHLSKRMLLDITRMLAMELAPRLRVNAVAPGLVLPPAGADEGYLQRLAHTNPLNRHGQAGDVARAVTFLLTARFVTGQVIYVDGGRHMKGNVYG